MNLYICEKGSLARNVVAALEHDGKKFKKEGEEPNTYYRSDTDIVIGLHGHILTLNDIEDYPDQRPTDGIARWSFDNIPYFPHQFKYKPSKDSALKFKQVKKFLKDPFVSTIYHIGDADREGEIIVRNVLKQCGNRKRVLRVWLDAETEECILRGIKNAKDLSEYDSLAAAGYFRTFSDWEYGINLTRYASLMKGTTMHIGRVIGCIVGAIRQRELEIENFKPETYYQSISDVDNIKLEYPEKFNEKKDAEEKSALLNKCICKVTDKNTKRVTTPPPKMYAQNTLQKEMSKRYGYAPNKTLQIAQSLYEKKLTSYPRTQSEYMNDEEKDDIRKLINNINKRNNTDVLVFKDNKSIFDSAKVGKESHSCIKPTTQSAKGISLTREEQNVYSAIMSRFFAVFCKEPCKEDKTTIVISAMDGDKNIHDFKLTGKVLIQEGWKKYEKSPDDKPLPDLKIGDIVQTDFKSVEKQTKPPAYYTDTSLLTFMERPLSKEEKEELNDDDKYYRDLLRGTQIGTVATRAPAIESMIKRGYIYLDKKHYRTTDKGKMLVDTMDKLGIDASVHKTVSMNEMIVDVQKGMIAFDDALAQNEKDIMEIIALKDSIKIEKAEDKGATPIGKCPRCGNDVVAFPLGYKCKSNDCDFVIWKKAKRGPMQKHTINVKEAKAFLNGETVKINNLYSEKKQKTFKGYVTAEDTGKYLNFKISFDSPGSEPKPKPKPKSDPKKL